MPEEIIPEKVEDKFKLSLLQIEKRFVDLEVAIGELNEKLKEVDTAAISELKQRVDDIEDLIMVEQLGISELKKMLEDLKKTEAQAVQAPPVPKEEIEKISAIANELENRLEKAEKNIQSIINEISNIRTETSNEIRKMKERVGNAPLYADMQFITNRVKDLKNTVDSLLNMKVEIDSKILNLERSLVEMGEERGVSPSVLKEMENTSTKISLLEKTVQEISEKIKSLDESKIEKIMGNISGIESYYSRFNQLYIEAQKKIEKIDETKAKFEEIIKDYRDRIIKLENSLNELKLLMHQTTSGLNEEVKEVKSKIENFSKEFSEKISKFEKIEEIENRIDVVETFTKEFDKKISKMEFPTEFLDKQISELLEKIVLLETRLIALEKTYQEQLVRVEPVIIE